MINEVNLTEGISFVPVISEEQREKVSELACKIWIEHYEAIIGREQVDYMINKFQTPEAMKEQIETGGYQYFEVENQSDIVGYFSIHIETEALFLSKIYLDKKCRGKNYARKIMNYLEELCIENNLCKIWLTVNRNNETSIAVYEKLGFLKTRTQVSDIGAGYVMDDYIMEKKIER